MKKLLKAAIAVALILWLGAIAKCEILTYLHGDEFADAWKNNSMLHDVDTFKVLECEKWYAKVYYKSPEGGDVLLFERDTGGWSPMLWYTVWSKQGSADDFIWPYIR